MQSTYDYYAQLNGVEYTSKITDGQLNLSIGQKQKIINEVQNQQMVILNDGSVLILCNYNKLWFFDENLENENYYDHFILKITICDVYNYNVCVLIKNNAKDGNKDYFIGYFNTHQFAISVKEEPIYRGMNKYIENAQFELYYDNIRVVYANENKEMFFYPDSYHQAKQIEDENGLYLKGTPIGIYRVEYDHSNYYSLFFHSNGALYYTSCDSNYNNFSTKTKFAEVDLDNMKSIVVVQVFYLNNKNYITGYDIFINKKDRNIVKISFSIEYKAGFKKGSITENKITIKKCAQDCESNSTISTKFTNQTTNTAAPKTKNTAAPKTTNTAVPKTTYTAAPKTTNTAVPKTTYTAAPKTTNTTAPKTTEKPQNTEQPSTKTYIKTTVGRTTKTSQTTKYVDSNPSTTNQQPQHNKTTTKPLHTTEHLFTKIPKTHSISPVSHFTKNVNNNYTTPPHNKIDTHNRSKAIMDSSTLGGIITGIIIFSIIFAYCMRIICKVINIRRKARGKQSILDSVDAVSREFQNPYQSNDDDYSYQCNQDNKSSSTNLELRNVSVNIHKSKISKNK